MGRLEVVTLNYVLKGSEHGRLFGSVTAKDVERVLGEKGIVIDRRQVRLVEPLKTIGEHAVQIKLHADVIAAVKVVIVSDTPPKVVAPIEAKGAAEPATPADVKSKGDKKKPRSPVVS